MRRFVRSCLVLAAALLAGCGDPSSSAVPGGPPPATVEVERVVPGEVVDVAEFTGALLADESVVLRPETAGIVTEITFAEGQATEKGALLIRLRDDEERARLQEARAALTLAEREAARILELGGDGVLSPEDIDRANAELSQAQARLQIAQVALERTQIRAPFDGVLGPRLVSPGQRVSGGGPARIGDGTTLVQIDAIDVLKLAFTVPEVVVPRMRPGIPLDISVTPYPGERFSGEVYFVAPSLDPLNRRLLVKAKIPNPERRLRAGLSATVHLEAARIADALTVPESAVVHDVAGAFVWRMASETHAERVPIKIGVRQPGRVQVTSGVAAGDRVVVAGTHKVAADRELRIAQAEAPADGEAPAQ